MLPQKTAGHVVMKVEFLYDKQTIGIAVPEHAFVYESDYPEPSAPAEEVVRTALEEPIGAPTLADALRTRRPGDVVVAVSDATRPVPYTRFLPELLGVIESAGVQQSEILILIATGMHRPSTSEEREEMFGREVVDRYRIVDHRAEADDELTAVDGVSWSGSRARVNRHFMSAGFRIVTGLVEPHFMAGFSGGRKTVCPGLVSLETIQKFHGEAFLADPKATNATLDGNPCHEESLSVARLVGVDYCVNVVINRNREVVGAYAGDMECVHEAACRFVSECACREVVAEADVVVTSSGGYPLDSTFYQCVKGFVSCLPAVKPGGTVIALGACRREIGSAEYAGIMKEHGSQWQDFLEHIKQPGVFTKDQWELQVHAKALAKVGQENLHFVSSGLSGEQLATLAVNGVSVSSDAVASAMQRLVDAAVEDGKTVAVFPEGPYCVVVG